MLKKKIKYTDYNGVEREEDFYFNLSKAELLKMEMTTEGGMEAKINRIIAEKDMPKLYSYFEDIVQTAYGVKSDDGRYFEKNETQLKRFIQSPAYDALILELIGDAKAASNFVNGIMPKDLAQKVAAASAKPGLAPVDGVVTPMR